MTLEEEMLNRASKEIAEEIDWGVMAGLLIEGGWERVTVDFGPRMSESTAHEIKEWVRTQCHGQVKSRNKTWLFENSKDATMFILRWS
jgi:hypothetical protein